METKEFLWAPNNRTVFKITAESDLIPALFQLEYTNMTQAKVMYKCAKTCL